MTDQIKLTEPQKAVHKTYAKALSDRGFCLMEDASSTHTPIFNFINKQRLPSSFLQNDFRKWQRINSIECEQFSISFAMSLLQHVVGSKFAPSQPKFIEESITGCVYINTYQQYKPSITDATISPLLIEYFERLIADAGERHIVLQWLAHMFQFTSQRPSWHVMLRSVQGTGKGFLVESILQPLLPGCTYVVSDFSHVSGRFSEVQATNALVLLDDAKATSAKTQTQLKSLLSESRIHVEKKNGAAAMQPTCARMILASNEEAPLVLEPGERRWYVTAYQMHRDDDSAATQAHIVKTAAWLQEPGNLDRVYNWFMSYDLAGFNHKLLPQSTGLQAMIELSRSPHANFVETFVSENLVFRYPDLIEAMQLEKMKPPSDREMVHVLHEVGYAKSQPRIDGKLVRLCHPIGMALLAIREAYKEPEPVF